MNDSLMMTLHFDGSVESPLVEWLRKGCSDYHMGYAPWWSLQSPALPILLPCWRLWPGICTSSWASGRWPWTNRHRRRPLRQGPSVPCPCPSFRWRSRWEGTRQHLWVSSTWFWCGQRGLLRLRSDPSVSSACLFIGKEAIHDKFSSRSTTIINHRSQSNAIQQQVDVIQVKLPRTTTSARLSHVPELLVRTILYFPLSLRTALRTVSTELRSYLSIDTLQKTKQWQHWSTVHSLTSKGVGRCSDVLLFLVDTKHIRVIVWSILLFQCRRQIERRCYGERSLGLFSFLRGFSFFFSSARIIIRN